MTLRSSQGRGKLTSRKMLAGRYRVTEPDGRHRDVSVTVVDGQLMMALPPETVPLRMQRHRALVYAVQGHQGVRVLFDVQDSHATGFILGRGFRPLSAIRVSDR